MINFPDRLVKPVLLVAAAYALLLSPISASTGAGDSEGKRPFTAQPFRTPKPIPVSSWPIFPRRICPLQGMMSSTPSDPIGISGT